ncbi:acetyl-CoA synthetase-like protein [Martensiomyces pterosporus]|nr:acetyl-CoA synthetase-like protein [Martensiomyces pterosporus]
MKSYWIPNSAQPGYSPILRHPDYKDGKQVDEYGGITTLYEVFQRMVSLFPSSQFLGTRQFNADKRTYGHYKWKTTDDAAHIIEEFGSGLVHVYEKYTSAEPASGLKQQPLGIYSVNRAEWLLAELGGFRSRKYTVALCATSSDQAIEHIVNHAEIKVIVCSADKVSKLLKLKDSMPLLRVVISMDSFAACDKIPTKHPITATSVRDMRHHAGLKNVVLLDMKQVIHMGRANTTVPKLPISLDLCTICYTPGTGGPPKAVMSTHASCLFAAKSLHHTTPVCHSTYLSFFTLAHCFERTVIYMGMLGGMRVGFYSGDIMRIAEDAQILHPTIMTGVPRLFNYVYDRISASTVNSPGLAGLVSRTAIGQKLQRLESGRGGIKHSFWDRLVSNRIAQYFGGKLELLIAGCGPMDVKVLNFLRVALACPILEGYGQVEGGSVATFCLLSDKTAGHVGVPMPGIDVRLRDVAEMGYLTTDKPYPRGELLIRGENVFQGYYRDMDATQAALDDDGWLATGDIAQFNEHGNIEIVDMKRNIFRLPHGEYVAPEHLENIYCRHPLIHNIFVYGDTERSDLVAVVVPEAEVFLPLARKITGNKWASIEDLANDEQVVGALLIVLLQQGKKAKLRGYEMITDVYCDLEPFDTSGNGLLTTTFKLRRNAAREYYRNQIEALYARSAECK